MVGINKEMEPVVENKLYWGAISHKTRAFTKCPAIVHKQLSPGFAGKAYIALLGFRNMHTTKAFV